jgi:hypothetical protein
MVMPATKVAITLTRYPNAQPVKKRGVTEEGVRICIRVYVVEIVVRHIAGLACDLRHCLGIGLETGGQLARRMFREVKPAHVSPDHCLEDALAHASCQSVATDRKSNARHYVSKERTSTQRQKVQNVDAVSRDHVLRLGFIEGRNDLSSQNSFARWERT